MDKLVSGVRQFMDSVFEKEETLFSDLAHGQSPDVFFVTCSDSRVAPHLVTQSGPGDLFVLRNAGNFIPTALDTGEAATVEYASQVLGVKDAIICGHSDCGAVQAVLNPPAAGALPAVEAWLTHGAEVLDVLERHPEWTGQERIDRAIEINVLVQLTRLAKHPSVTPRLEDGSLLLHAWVYDIGSGQIRAFDPEAGSFRPLGEATTPIPHHHLHVVPNVA